MNFWQSNLNKKSCGLHTRYIRLVSRLFSYGYFKLIVHTWQLSVPYWIYISSELQCTNFYRFQQLLEGPIEVLLCERLNDRSNGSLNLSPQLSHNDMQSDTLEERYATKSHREQSLETMQQEGVELSSDCPSWSNSLWQGWSCGLVHCPEWQNTTDPIWSQCCLSSLGIFSWEVPGKTSRIVTLTPRPYWPINSGVLTSLLLPHPLIIPHRLYAFLVVSYATQKLMLDSCKMVEKQSESFHIVSVAFFHKFTHA